MSTDSLPFPFIPPLSRLFSILKASTSRLRLTHPLLLPSDTLPRVLSQRRLYDCTSPAMMTSRRTFGTDTLNARNPLNNNQSSSSSSSMNNIKQESAPQAQRNASAMLGSWNAARRPQRSGPALGDRLLNVKAPSKDRTWLRDMEREQQQSEAAVKSGQSCSLRVTVRRC